MSVDLPNLPDLPTTARGIRVLGSPRNAAEAETLLAAGIAVIDAKNPDEGSLGAPTPSRIVEIQRVASAWGAPLSVALGDLQHQPGTAALAAAAAAGLGANFVKAGLFGSRTVSQAASLMEAVGAAAREARASVEVVACGYADYPRFTGLPPDQLIDAALRAGSDYVMLDTYFKDGGSLLDVLALDELEQFVAAAHAQQLKVALAGSLRRQHLPQLAALQPDMIGVRGALCDAQDRNASVCPTQALEFMQLAADTKLWD